MKKNNYEDIINHKETNLSKGTTNMSNPEGEQRFCFPWCIK